MDSLSTRFLGHTQWRATVDRIPLDEWSGRRRDLYLTIHTTDKHPHPRWDSNPQSQWASGHRPTPWSVTIPSLIVLKKFWLCHTSSFLIFNDKYFYLHWCLSDTTSLQQMEEFYNVKSVEDNNECQRESWSFLPTLKLFMKEPNHMVSW
jgi:hypothetical protein